MAPRQLPGIYMILCLANNKRYYGESNNVSSRLSQHKSRLRLGEHEVKEMQRDFNLYGEASFEFSCLFINKNMTREDRLKMEAELIGKFNSLCYNKFDKTDHKGENNPFWNKTHTAETRKRIGQSLAENRKNSELEGFAILLKGIAYPSISEASRQTNHSRDTIRRWLNDPNNKDCVAINGNKCSQTLNLETKYDPLVSNTGIAKPVQIHGQIYESITEASRRLKCSRPNIQRLLRKDPINCFIIEKGKE